MRHSLNLFAMLLSISVCFVGCSPTSVTESPTSIATPDGASGDTETPPAASVELKLVKADEYTAELEARKGKVLLIDMWTTW